MPDALRSNPLFAGLDDAVLGDIANCATAVDLPAGHVLIHPGQEGSGMFVIEEGSVTVELGAHTIDCGSGEVIGELSLLVDGLVHTGRVRAKTQIRCLAISRHDFLALLDKHPKIAVNMLGVLARRLADTDRMLQRS